MESTWWWANTQAAKAASPSQSRLAATHFHTRGSWQWWQSLACSSKMISEAFHTSFVPFAPLWWMTSHRHVLPGWTHWSGSWLMSKMQLPTSSFWGQLLRLLHKGIDPWRRAMPAQRKSQKTFLPCSKPTHHFPYIFCLFRHTVFIATAVFFWKHYKIVFSERGFSKTQLVKPSFSPTSKNTFSQKMVSFSVLGNFRWNHYFDSVSWFTLFWSKTTFGQNR